MNENETVSANDTELITTESTLSTTETQEENANDFDTATDDILENVISPTISDGNRYFYDNSSISSGDNSVFDNISVTSVSGSDSAVGSESTTEVIQTEYYKKITTEIQHINYMLMAILFFIVFMWVEKKLLTAVRRFFRHANTH